LSRLLKSSEEIAKLQRQLLEAQNQIAQLEQANQQLNEEIEEEALVQGALSKGDNSDRDLGVISPCCLPPSKSLFVGQMPQQEVAAEPATRSESENLNERMEKLEQLVYELVEKIDTKASVADVPTLTAIPVPRVAMKVETDKDWSEVKSEELKGSKARGAADEKILRSFQALANYNDNVAASNSERWYIGNVTLRQLSGCNGQLVGDWIKRHQLSVDDHNNKYGLGQYHNKGRGDVTSVVSW
jgi:DNA repair exonuclease SbcCD ATPase subunit